MPITTTIVRLNATITPAPLPSTLQQRVAEVSLGATSQATNSVVYYPSLASALAVISGSTGNHAELTAMVTTHFAQGTGIGLYILELGIQATALLGIAALTTWLANNPNRMYIFVTPATWDASPGGPALNTLAGLYSATTARTYFAITTTSANLSQYQVANKAIIPFVLAPSGVPSTEFGAAAIGYAIAQNNPNAASPLQPLGYRFVTGITPWPDDGSTEVTEDTILTAFGNIFVKGSEGALTTNSIFRGTTIDGNQFNYWYGIDYVLIQAKTRLAAYIMAGANRNPPLEYNQLGINELLAQCEAIGSAGATAGCLLSSSFSAVNFNDYVTANPSDYPAGIYNGLQATVTPQTGILSVTFNLDAVGF